jgi:hypothetical protein
MAKPLIRGKNATLRVFIDGKAVDLPIEDWSLDEDRTEHTDHVGGENRARYDSTINGYKLSFNSFMSSLAAIDAFLEDTANEDAKAVPLTKAATLTFRPRDGSSKTYVLSELSRGPWKKAGGKRPDPNKISMSMSARNYDPAPSF